MLPMNPFGIVGAAKGIGGGLRNAAFGAGIHGIGAALNPWAYRGAIGAGMGGLYGALSDDTSVLGGAVAGGMMGRYGLPFMRTAGLMAFHPRSGFGVGMKALKGATRMTALNMFRDGKASGRFLGRTLRRGYNGFRSMGR